MEIKTFIIDAFTDKPFTGNPAGVCLLNGEIEERLMQSIANELNLSETAFLHQKASGNQYHIRYFTPTVEIDFCGHATLASAKLILDKLGKEDVEFLTHKNLKISAVNEGKLIKMQFPIYETSSYEASKTLLKALGIESPIFSGYCKELDMLLIEVESKEYLLQVSPNFEEAIKSTDEIKEVVVTSKSEDKEYDFYSRCFCPWIGINEDPVTGASHSVLAKYWGNKLDKEKMSAYQVSKRGGFLELKLLDEKKLEVGSQAQIVFEGKLTINERRI